MKETQIIRLPLQFFAEGEDTGTETEGGSEGGSDGQEKAPTFDDILKDKSMQAEFDRRVSKAMEKQKASLIRATYIKPAEESLPRLHSYILILLPLLSYSVDLLQRNIRATDNSTNSITAALAAVFVLS